MSTQRDLLDALAKVDELEHDKKESVKAYNEDIKFWKKEAKRLRGELEAQRAATQVG